MPSFSLKPPFLTEGSDMEVHIMESSQCGVNLFVKSWINAATTAQGLAVRLTAECRVCLGSKLRSNPVSARDT